MSIGRKQRVQAHSKRILHHRWNYPLKNRAVDLKTGIVVHLDEPGLEVSVNHEIKPKYLEIVPMATVVDGGAIGSDNICCQFLHFGQDVLFEAQIAARVCKVQISLKL